MPIRPLQQRTNLAPLPTRRAAPLQRRRVGFEQERVEPQAPPSRASIRSARLSGHPGVLADRQRAGRANADGPRMYFHTLTSAVRRVGFDALEFIFHVRMP
jgi:hypothetical protein